MYGVINLLEPDAFSICSSDNFSHDVVFPRVMEKTVLKNFSTYRPNIGIIYCKIISGLYCSSALLLTVQCGLITRRLQIPAADEQDTITADFKR